MGWPFRKKVLDTQAALAAVLGDAPLPTFPSLVLELMGDLRDPDLPVRQIADKLRLDPRLSVNVLQMANSAAYGARRTIDDVHHASVFLGRRSLESLVLSIAVREALPAPSSPSFDNSRFWRAAARRAATAQGLAGKLHPRTRGLSFTAALLSDMAIPLLVDRRHQDYAPILRAWHGADGDLPDLESERFGWTHADVASWLCDRWTIPDTLRDAIGGHHLEEFDETQVPPAVHLVGMLSERLDDPEIEPIVETARSQYGLAPDTTRDVIEEAFEQADALAVLLVA
jgi:HD-like signal output (HDOD) protein